MHTHISLLFRNVKKIMQKIRKIYYTFLQILFLIVCPCPTILVLFEFFQNLFTDLLKGIFPFCRTRKQNRGSNNIYRQNLPAYQCFAMSIWTSSSAIQLRVLRESELPVRAFLSCGPHSFTLGILDFFKLTNYEGNHL